MTRVSSQIYYAPIMCFDQKIKKKKKRIRNQFKRNDEVRCDSSHL